MDRGILDNCTDGAIADGIAQMRALEATVQRTMLEFVAVFDAREAWRDDGATSMAAWLTMHGYSNSRARDMVRAAGALEDLPAVAETMLEGRTTFDQIAQVTRYASPETDELIASDAPGRSVAELRRIAQRSVGVDAEGARAAHERRMFRSRWDHDRSELKFWGRVPATQGATIESVLDHVAEAAPRDPETGEQEPYDRRMADALSEVCTAALAERASTDPAAATIVVHGDASLLEASRWSAAAHGAQPGSAEIQDGPQLAITTVERLLCDNRWQIALTNSEGCCVGVGHVTRKIPRWIRRQLARRDTGCMFPGCNRTRWLEAHHIIAWRDGGPTDLWNLVLICTEHHTLIHEGGWTLKGDHNNLTFFRPDGSLLNPTPERLRPEIRDRIVRMPTSSPASDLDADDTS